MVINLGSVTKYNIHNDDNNRIIRFDTKFIDDIVIEIGTFNNFLIDEKKLSSNNFNKNHIYNFGFLLGNKPYCNMNEFNDVYLFDSLDGNGLRELMFDNDLKGTIDILIGQYKDDLTSSNNNVGLLKNEQNHDFLGFFAYTNSKSCDENGLITDLRLAVDKIKSDKLGMNNTTYSLIVNPLGDFQIYPRGNDYLDIE
jgi:hypothetical protein